MINDREDWTEMEHEKADIKKRMQYILNMRPVFNKEALFSDGTEYYRIPAEPKAGDTVTIKFRTQRCRFCISGKPGAACADGDLRDRERI